MVVPADAVIEPQAMVVLGQDTVPAFGAVAGLIWTKDVTGKAVLLNVATGSLVTSKSYDACVAEDVRDDADAVFEVELVKIEGWDAAQGKKPRLKRCSAV